MLLEVRWLFIITAKCSLGFKYSRYKVSELDSGLNWLPLWPSSVSDPCASIIIPECSITLKHGVNRRHSHSRRGMKIISRKNGKKKELKKNKQYYYYYHSTGKKQKLLFSFISVPPAWSLALSNHSIRITSIPNWDIGNICQWCAGLSI